MPDAKELQGFTHYNIAFWTTQGALSAASAWNASGAAERAQVKAQYKAAGIKLVISAFGSTDTPMSKGYKAAGVAAELADFVRSNDLDGVDIDFEETDLVQSGRATPWLVDLTTALRQALPRKQGYVLSHAPMAPYFSPSWATSGRGYLDVEAQVGKQIDFYLTQFYNQEGSYETCDTLLTTSGAPYAGSSLFEINKNGVPRKRLVVGKPATAADGSSGYMDPSALGQCLAQARKLHWDAGISFWQFPHTQGVLGTVQQAAGWASQHK